MKHFPSLLSSFFLTITAGGACTDLPSIPISNTGTGVGNGSFATLISKLAFSVVVVAGCSLQLVCGP